MIQNVGDRRVEVRTTLQQYPILIGSGVIRRLGQLATLADGVERLLVVADERVVELHQDRIKNHLPSNDSIVMLPAGEATKSWQVASGLLDQLAAARLQRNDLVVAIGGGVIGDLAGFVAAIWLRGIRFLQVPTTLEACIDASIGGKTGINHTAGKNLIGAFHHPVAVLIDTDFLATLPPREFSAGLAESVKHGLIAEAEFFVWHERNAAGILQAREPILGELIARNCAIKAEVVGADEREAGRRMILNYGHTIGHAIEHCLGYELRHGECVGLGMLCAGEIARRRGRLSAEDCGRVQRLLTALRLPTLLPRPLAAPDVLAAIQMDKKNRGDRLHFVLLQGIGRCEIVTDVTSDEIAAALGVIQP